MNKSTSEKKGNNNLVKIIAAVIAVILLGVGIFFIIKNINNELAYEIHVYNPAGGYYSLEVIAKYDKNSKELKSLKTINTVQKEEDIKCEDYEQISTTGLEVTCSTTDSTMTYEMNIRDAKVMEENLRNNYTSGFTTIEEAESSVTSVGAVYSTLSSCDEKTYFVMKNERKVCSDFKEYADKMMQSGFTEDDQSDDGSESGDDAEEQPTALDYKRGDASEEDEAIEE